MVFSEDFGRVVRQTFVTFAPGAVGVALWRSATRPAVGLGSTPSNTVGPWLSVALLALAAALVVGRRAVRQFIGVARGRTHPLDTLEVHSGLAGMIVASGSIATSFAAPVMALIGP